MIEVRGLTKRYGDRLAVDRLSFRVEPGRVTGFLGPNGAGKSTTMRMVLGLDAPSGGTATVNGTPYRELPAPLREVGALLDAGAVHGGRRAHDHLLWLARSNRIPRSRAGEVLELVGLGPVGGRRVRGFSLGMRQRLGIAAALLGDPGVLVLDEPVNGLDTEGISWIRRLLRELAAQGRTVLVSSHLMGEMELTADHLLVIGGGRLLADTTMRDLVERGSGPSTMVRSPHWERLRPWLVASGAEIEPAGDGRWWVRGPDTAAIGTLAAEHRVPLHELAPRRSSLEEAYLRMTGTGA
jgi:ABC-2 type transport system ATP-binding protein